MGLFRKKQPELIVETGYDEVVEFLRNLTQQDYNKILKVVNLYRDADKGVKKVLGIKDTPALDDIEMDDLFSDDTDTGNFLTDDEPPVTKPKPKVKKAAKK